MVRSTARTGKLKRSKARRPSDAAGHRPHDPADPSTRHASVGELLAALDGGRRAESAEAPSEPAEASTEPTAVPGEQAPAAAGSAEDELAARARRWIETDPDDLGLAGYEDDESQDDPPPDEPAPAPTVRADGVELSDTLPMAPEDDLSRVKGQASPRLMSVIESLLFASEKPLTVRDIRRILKEPTVRQVQLALKQLQIDTAERGVVLSQVAGGFRLRTNPSNAQWVQRMLAGKPARLSRSQLEALAVIAYRQPITKAEIDHVRGVDCGAVLRVLLERNLCRIVGRKEDVGRPHLYGTTVEFLEFFNLRSLRDMPDLHEFRELTDESRATVRAEFGEDVDELEAEVLGQEVLSFDGGSGQAAAPATDDEAAAEQDAGQGGEETEAREAAEDREAAEPAELESSAEPGGAFAGEGSEASEDAAAPETEASEETEALEGSEASEDAAAPEVPPEGAEALDDSDDVEDGESSTDSDDVEGSESSDDSDDVEGSESSDDSDDVENGESSTDSDDVENAESSTDSDEPEDAEALDDSDTPEDGESSADDHLDSVDGPMTMDDLDDAGEASEDPEEAAS